jgi:hypothetical protein
MAHHFSAENKGGGEFFALVPKNGTKRQKCKLKTRKTSAEIRRKKTPIIVYENHGEAHNEKL